MKSIQNKSKRIMQLNQKRNKIMKLNQIKKEGFIIKTQINQFPKKYFLKKISQIGIFSS